MIRCSRRHRVIKQAQYARQMRQSLKYSLRSFKEINMDIQHLKGLIAAPFTPMKPNGDLNLDLIPGYYAMLKANKVNGAFICGSTGEGVSMTAKEKMAVISAWAACTKDDAAFTVMPLLGGTSVADCKELALYAEAAGMDAVSFTCLLYTSRCV